MLPKIIIGVVLIFLAIFFLRPFDPTGPLGRNSENSKKTESFGNIPVVFTHPIFNPEEIDFVSPLGESNGGYIEVQPLGGMTINIKKELAEKGPINIYAPADMELVAYAHTLMEPELQADWSLYFRINDDLSLVIHHVKNANQKIIDVVGNNPKKNDSRTTDVRWPNEIKFKAGEIIGTTTGTSKAHNWNVYLYDKQVKNQFVNQKRYESSQVGERLLTSACFFDYYQDEKIKSAFYSLLGRSKPGETKNCGTPSKDRKGTISGLWHAKLDGIDMGSYDGPYADPFSVYLRSDNNITIYELNKKAYTVYSNNPSHKDPAAITDSHCYLLTDDWNPNEYKGYAYFKVDSDTQMSVAFSPTGSCPAAFPNIQTKTYYR